MRWYTADPTSPLLVLAHGAGAGESHPWMRAVGQGLAERGVSVVTFEFAYMAEQRRRPDPGPALENQWAETWREVHREVAHQRLSPRRWFAGGKSMGGRISSQAAARDLLTPAPSGLVFFGYPLHPPGQPEKKRDRHLGALDLPLLFLSGTRDPFGTPDELRALEATLPRATLVLIDGGDHSLRTTRRAGAGPLAAEALDSAAEWISLDR